MSLFKLRPIHLVVAATLVGVFLRFYHLSSHAPEAWFDEIWFAMRAREMLAAPQFVVFYRTSWGGGNALMVYLTAAVQWLGFTGLSSSRIASAALGAVSVPLAFACFDEVLRGSGFQSGSVRSVQPRLRRWIAALAAFILSYLIYWVVVSRVGTEPSLAPAATLFCVWQLKRARRLIEESTTKTQRQEAPQRNLGGTSRRAFVVNPSLNFALAGVVAGLAQYNGPHARFILPLVGLIGLHDLFLIPAPLRRNYIVGLSLAALAGLVVVAPLALFFIQEPHWLVARAREATARSFTQQGALWENIKASLIAYNFTGSLDSLTNYPGLPVFDPIQSIGFFVGHGWVLWNLRRSAVARELLGWEILMTLPSLIANDAPSFQRMIGYGAPGAAVVAVGWVVLWQWFGPHPRRLGVWNLGFARCWRAVPGILAFGIFASFAYQSYMFLVKFPRLSVLPKAYLAVPVNTARELIKRAEAGERVFVSRNPEDDDVISFEYLFPGTPVKRLDFRQCLPFSDGRPARSNYLVLTKRDAQTVPILYQTYPTASIEVESMWQDSGSWVEVPAGISGPRPPNPGHASFDPGLTFVGYEWSGGTVQAGQSLFITLWWKVEADMTADYTSFVHVGTGLDGTTVVAQRDGQPCQGLFTTSQWRAGDLVRDSFAITFPPDVLPGDYPLVTGWYTFPSFTRLSLREADHALPDNRAIIGVVTVRK
ncbi:MAG: hypothetical protein HYZ49_15355 [Chloroflexi bacterium]|nr:hypothetical protein [Chloroflexota bacterium]